jgi:hypothetical protein
MGCAAQVDAPVESSGRASARPSSDRAAHVVSATQLVRAALSRAPSNLQRVERLAGTHFIRITSGFRRATLALRATDGSRHTTCVNDAEEAAHLLQGDVQ